VPKSSIAILTPRFFMAWSRRAVDSVFRIRAVSVTSMIKVVGSRPLIRRASRTMSTMVSSSSWRPETLTETSRVSPRACQVAICWQASPSTQRPTSRIRPLCSRIGMNSSGCMSPKVGCSKCSSASSFGADSFLYRTTPP